MKIRLMIYTLTFTLILMSLCGCARPEPPPEQVLLALTEAEIGLPAGQIYLASAGKEEASYLSPDLISALYGKGELPWQLSLIEDYGIFLSITQHPCEFAVFRCYSRSDTDLVAAMCHERLDALCAHYGETEYERYTEQAAVAVIGKHVLLLVSADARHALATARRVL